MLLRLALVVVLVLAVAPGVAAADTARLTYQLDGDRLTAYVVGPERTGAWRIRIVNPSGLHRIDFVLRTGDIAWSGLIRVAALDGGTWRVTRTIRLDAALAGRTRVTGCNAAVCWDSARLRTPRNGDRKFGVTVSLARDGRYLLSGGVRLAREPFILGPWQATAAVAIRH